MRDHSATSALQSVLARIDALLTALEARPDTEGPLEACRAVIDADEGQVLAMGSDEMLVMDLLAGNPSLAGRAFWKMQAVTGRLTLEFRRRMGLAHTDLQPQLLAAGVVAAAHAAVSAWLSNPSGPSDDEHIRQGLAHLADGLGDPPT